MFFIYAVQKNPMLYFYVEVFPPWLGLKYKIEMRFQCPTYRTQTPCKLCKLEGFSRCLAFDWEAGRVPEKTFTSSTSPE